MTFGGAITVLGLFAVIALFVFEELQQQTILKRMEVTLE